MRKLENFVRKYGPDAGPKLYHILQSQAAHAGVSARLRRKIAVLTGRFVSEPKSPKGDLPRFPETPAREPAGTEIVASVFA